MITHISQSTVSAIRFLILFSVLSSSVRLAATTDETIGSMEMPMHHTETEHQHQSARETIPHHSEPNSKHSMMFDKSGMVMNNNPDQLPIDCNSINGAHKFTVYAGVEYAFNFPGMVYGLSQHEYFVKPCSRVEITFINKDSVRHQWMIHGLPRYLYPRGMFSLEVMGGQSKTGTFIVPADTKTYLVHCDLAQHMEKGMKAQLKVGKGDGDLWSIPGVSKTFKEDIYRADILVPISFISAIIALLLSLLVIIRLR